MRAKKTTKPEDLGAKSGFPASLVPRLPRMVAVTIAAVFSTFAAIQFLPQTYEARLAVALPDGGAPDLEAGRLTDQAQLGEIVSRLSPDVVAELRRTGGGVLDTTALLRQRLSLSPVAGGTALQLAATAMTPARARAIVEATAELFGGPDTMPPALAGAEKTASMANGPVEEPAVLQERLSLAWEKRVRLESRAERIADLIETGNYAMLAMDAEGLPGLGRRLDDLAALEAERDKLAVTLLPNHPTMRTLEEEIATLHDQLEGEVNQLAQLVTADRDAARRLEDGLRDDLALAMAAPAVDDTIMTGSIAAPAETEVTALPRPVRTDLTLALVGGLAFFGQVGLHAIRRRPRRDTADRAADLLRAEPVPDDDFSFAVAPDMPAAPASPVFPAPVAAEQLPVPEEHNWLATATAVELGASWVEPSKPVAPQRGAAVPQREETMRPEAARVLAIRMDSHHAYPRQALALHRGQRKRVVLVDAASRQRGRAPGISDLSLGKAGFGDVVHGSGPYEAAMVPWGRQGQFDPAARQVSLLVEALAELYDVVIVLLDRDNPVALAPLAALADLVIDAEDLPAPRQAA
ncbi:hypothetical protein DMC47_16380 [Nostoc sp. 3335mG]|nr:hypothetical protein DMC47_16380 [Nostoc sp. 3335mG]